MEQDLQNFAAFVANQFRFALFHRVELVAVDVIDTVGGGDGFHCFGGGVKRRVFLGLRFGVGFDYGFALGDFAFGASEVDHFKRDFFPFFTFGAVEADAVLLYFSSPAGCQVPSFI